jgi:hypothetical protein
LTILAKSLPKERPFNSLTSTNPCTYRGIANPPKGPGIIRAIQCHAYLLTNPYISVHIRAVRAVSCRSCRFVSFNPYISVPFVPFRAVRAVSCRSCRFVSSRFVQPQIGDLKVSNLLISALKGLPKDRPFNSLSSTNSRTYRARDYHDQTSRFIPPKWS